VTITSEASKTLTWGGGGGTWNTTTTNTPWKDGDTDEAFYTGDSVIFSKDETATIAVDSAGVTAGTMTVSAGTITLTGGTVSLTSLSGSGTLSLNEDAGISLTSKLTAKADFSKVSGSGTISVIGGTGNGQGVTLGSDFTGTLYVKKDSSASLLLLSDSSLGTAKILVGSGADLVFNGTGTNVSNDITFEGNSSIHANQDKNGTLSGKVSSTGTLTKAGGGTLTIAGTANIGTLTLSSGSMVVSAGGSMAANTSLTLNGTNKSTLVFTGDIGAATINITNGDVTWTHNDADKSSAATITIGEGSSFKDNSRSRENFPARER